MASLRPAEFQKVTSLGQRLEFSIAALIMACALGAGSANAAPVMCRAYDFKSNIDYLSKPTEVPEKDLDVFFSEFARRVVQEAGGSLSDLEQRYRVKYQNNAACWSTSDDGIEQFKLNHPGDDIHILNVAIVGSKVPDAGGVLSGNAGAAQPSRPVASVAAAPTNSMGISGAKTSQASSSATDVCYAQSQRHLQCLSQCARLIRNYGRDANKNYANERLVARCQARCPAECSSAPAAAKAVK